MYKTIFILSVVLTTLSLSCTRNINPKLSEIESEFKNVPDSIKPWTYWYWVSDNISKEGISKDLEAMAEIGVGTALIGNVGLDNVEGGDILMLSDEWWELMRWAVKEGKRTGVDIGVFNCPGWSQSGGPWIKAENSMRFLISSETKVKGGRKVKTMLPAPRDKFQDVVTLAYPAKKVDSGSLKNVEHTISVVPMINNISNVSDGDKNTNCMFESLQGESVSLTFETEKELSVKSLHFYPAEKPVYVNCKLYAKDGKEFILIKEFLVDRMNANISVGPVPYAPVAVALNGIVSNTFRLDLEFVPSPRNTILKGGINEIELSETPVLEYYQEKQLAKLHQIPWFNGKEYQWPEQQEVTDGNKLFKLDNILNISDKLSENGELMWDVPEGDWIVQRIGMAPTGVKNAPVLPHARGYEVDKINAEAVQFHFDSYIGKFYESLPEADREAFKYVYADSYEMGSLNWTDDLEKDFINKYGYDPMPWLPVLTGNIVESVEQSNRFLWDLRRLVADFIPEKYVKGLKNASNEKGLKLGLENVGHWGFPGETLLYGKHTDFQAGEFWNEGALGNWENRIASSTAHIYGKPKVYCESFTAGGLPFQRSPMTLKKRGDWSYTEGVNHTILHLHILQPDDKLKPGYNAGFGTEFNRLNTWYFNSKSWIDYQRRNNYLLQQGKYVADVCYFYGEDTPILTGYQNIPLPKGYSFDYINYDVIMNYLDVNDGRWVLPDGMSYGVMVLPDKNTMRPETLEKIAQLVEKGGVIVGNAPVKSPSLKDFPACDKQVSTLAEKLWNNIDGNSSNINTYGKGKVFSDISLEEVLNDIGISPDLHIEENVPVLWIHRSLPRMDIYFLTNQSGKAISFDALFRVKGMKPQWWSAIDGSTRSLPQFQENENGISIPVKLEALESGYVIFKKNADEPKTKSNFPDVTELFEITSDWDVDFTDPFGEKFERNFSKLENWINSDDENLKYFSGKAVYKTTFNSDINPDNTPLFIILGKVQVIARVKLNGVELGTLWTNPWKLEITNAIKQGENELEVEVVNNWNNRMVGDAGKEERKSWAPVDIFKPDSKLQASGLIGPITIETIQE